MRRKTQARQEAYHHFIEYLYRNFRKEMKGILLPLSGKPSVMLWVGKQKRLEETVLTLLAELLAYRELSGAPPSEEINDDMDNYTVMEKMLDELVAYRTLFGTWNDVA